ncbi:MAG: hypothetical protein SCALA702_06050 [Melioribacteraceae bacterium]|nr:MAG: hypothetical protein SCALA702_06050 [Melioribacteraceae bacterium]
MSCRSNLVNLFVELASINALSGEEKPVIDFLINFAEKRKLPYIFEPIPEKCPEETGNIIFTVNGGGHKLFVSHMDTVRPTNKLRVQFDGKTLKSDGRSVLGADNRAGIAAILFYIDEYLSIPGDKEGFYAAFTVCEETNLAGSLNLDFPAEVEHAFVFDSYLRPGKIITSSFGALGFNIILTGVENEGNKVLQAAKNILSKLPQGRVESETTFTIDIKENKTDTKEVLLEGDIRSSARGRIEEHLENLKALTKQVCSLTGCDFTLKINWDFKPYSLENNSSILQLAKEAIETSGLEYEELVSIGGSDANSFNERGLPAVNFGIGAQNPHSFDEFIEIEDFENVVEIIRKLVSSK